MKIMIFYLLYIQSCSACAFAFYLEIASIWFGHGIRVSAGGQKLFAAWEYIAALCCQATMSPPWCEHLAITEAFYSVCLGIWNPLWILLGNSFCVCSFQASLIYLQRHITWVLLMHVNCEESVGVRMTLPTSTLKVKLPLAFTARQRLGKRRFVSFQHCSNCLKTWDRCINVTAMAVQIRSWLVSVFFRWYC